MMLLLNDKNKSTLMMAMVCLAHCSYVFADEQPATLLGPDIPPPSSKPVSPNIVVAQPALDASSFASTGRQQAAAVPWGPFSVTPSLGVGAGYNSNITASSANAISSPVWAVKPTVAMDTTVSGDRYVMGYLGNFTRYSNHTANNFNTNELQLAAENIYTSKLSSKTSADLLYSIDPPGSTQGPVTPTPNRFRQAAVKGLVAYGAQNAIGHLELEAAFQQKRYLNNRTVTLTSDLDSGNVTGRFYYRVAPKTQTFLELGQTGYRYLVNASTQNSTERHAYVGATWDATAKTSGTLKLGLLRKDFSDATKSNFDGLGWEATVRWAPLTYSTLDLQTARNTSDSTGVGAYLINRVLGATWNHGWSNFVTTRLGYTWQGTEYVGNPRIDNTDRAVMGVEYRARRWLTFNADYNYVRLRSNAPSTPYTQNLFMVSANATL